MATALCTPDCYGARLWFCEAVSVMKLCCGWRCACSAASPATADESARAVVQPFPLADEFIDFEVRIRTLRSDLETERQCATG